LEGGLEVGSFDGTWDFRRGFDLLVIGFWEVVFREFIACD
jgi:hypothetical protein